MLKINVYYLMFTILAASYSVTFSEPSSLPGSFIDSIQMIMPDSVVSILDSDASNRKITSPRDTISYKVFHHYNLWCRVSRICEYLSAVATSEGFDATQLEINSRHSLYSLAFPGISFNIEQINKEIITEKYLIQKIGIFPSSEELSEKYLSYTKNSPEQKTPSFADIKPLLINNVLMSMDTVQFLCKNQAELHYQKDRETIAEKAKTWDYREIALSADPNRCLIVSHENNGCLSTVGEFNTFLKLNPVRKNLSLENARNQALRTLSIQLYYFGKAEREGLSNRDDIITPWEQFEYNKRLCSEYPFLSKNLSDTKLLSAYNKYYERFFKKKIIRTIALFGSTDTTYIDSISSNIKKLEEAQKANRNIKLSEYLDSLPWIVLTNEDLPDTILSCIASLRMGQWRTIKTPFGYFIGRVLTITYQPEYPFEQALHKLEYLIHTDMARAKGKPDSLLAREYYDKHKYQFMIPDTAFCRVWLVPSRDSSTFLQMDQTFREQIIFQDTHSFRPGIFGSHRLPVKLADKLLQTINDSDTIKKFFGPVFNQLGTWYFSITSFFPGRGYIPFNKVEEHICKNKLQLESFPFDSILSTEAGKCISKRTALANAYRDIALNQIKKKINEIPDVEIRTLIDNHTIRLISDDNPSSDALLLNKARNQIIDNKVEEDLNNVQQWVESLIIDRSLLLNETSKRF